MNTCDKNQKVDDAKKKQSTSKKNLKNTCDNS